MAEWVCPRCGFRADLFSGYYWKCPRCGSPLDIVFKTVYRIDGRGFSRYSGLLPFTPLKSIGEGGTPLVVVDSSSRLLFKLEYLNPSGSFKDRGSSLALTYAYRAGFERVVEDTSGNTGISITLYSRVYGLEPVIYMPRDAPPGKKKLIRLLGGRIVETSSRREAMEKVLEASHNAFYVAHTWNPLYILGASTISYEVHEDGEVPDYTIIPVGSGGLFLGIMRGFETLYKLGLIKKIPVPIIVEGVSNYPVYKALHGEHGLKGTSRLADGIMVPEPPRLDDIVIVLKRYHGRIILVDDEEIKTALRELIDYGFIVEPTSATVWAAYKKIRDELRGKNVLLPLTGSGLKMIEELLKIIRE